LKLIFQLFTFNGATDLIQLIVKLVELVKLSGIVIVVGEIDIGEVQLILSTLLVFNQETSSISVILLGKPVTGLLPFVVADIETVTLFLSELFA